MSPLACTERPGVLPCSAHVARGASWTESRLAHKFTVVPCSPVSQATCERGFAAMEESHQKVIDELQRKHQRELENLQQEKERLLAEETAATIAGNSQRPP